MAARNPYLSPKSPLTNAQTWCQCYWTFCLRQFVLPPIKLVCFYLATNFTPIKYFQLWQERFSAVSLMFLSIACQYLARHIIFAGDKHFSLFCCDTQHNDNQLNDTQHCDFEHEDTQHSKNSALWHWALSVAHSFVFLLLRCLSLCWVSCHLLLVRQWQRKKFLYH
jgi:hypothetical protein